jgi:hypothetical protein
VATQTRLPGTLPTLAQAKARLRESRGLVETRARTLEEMRGHKKTAKGDLADAEAAVDAAECDLLAALAGSAEETAADGAHAKAMRATEKAEEALRRVEHAVQRADSEHEDARRELTGARSELRAVREGRRAR